MVLQIVLNVDITYSVCDKSISMNCLNKWLVQCARVCVCVCRPPCGVPASGLVFPLHSCYVYVEICMCGVCIVEFVFGVCMWSVESPLCSLYVETLGGLHTFEWTLCSESV